MCNRCKNCGVEISNGTQYSGRPTYCNACRGDAEELESYQERRNLSIDNAVNKLNAAKKLAAKQNIPLADAILLLK